MKEYVLIFFLMERDRLAVRNRIRINSKGFGDGPATGPDELRGERLIKPSHLI